MPLFLGLLSLTILYLVRWTILQEPLSTAIETAVFDASGVRVEVGAIHGSMLREVRVDTIRTVQSNPDGAVHSLRVDALVVRYRLADLLPYLSLTNLPLPRFTSPATDIGWLETDGLTAGLVVTKLSRALPASLTLDLLGGAVVNALGERSSAGIRLTLDAAASGEGRQARVELSEIASPWWPGASDDTLSLVLSVAPGRLALRTDGERSIGEVRIDGALESSDADGPATLTGAHIAISAGDIHARAAANSQSAELFASLPGHDLSNEIVNRVLAARNLVPGTDTSAPDRAAPGLIVGALDLEADLRLPPSDPPASPEESASTERSVVAELFSRPALLMEDAEVFASIDARSWRLASVAVEQLTSSAGWANGRFSLGTSSAAGEVEGLDLATASDPATGFALSLGTAGWDTVANELSLDDLVVRGGGGRLRIDGLVTLPAAGSGLESVSGDLVGQLSVNQPDELATLLSRIGIAPLLPEGYSIGTSVAVDFALSGSRANTRLDVGLRAQGPAVPGLAFESIEADAAITSDSATMNGLRVQTVEVLAIATASNPGTGFALSLQNGEWDTAANQLSVEELVVHGGGSRLQLDGLVTLPAAGSGLESVSGDLAGRLSIDQPDELATLLSRIGIAPLLPEGYSIGTSVAVDFALSGSRADTRLDVGLRAQGPAVPGLAFESIEADAAITSDSATVLGLRVETVEILAIATSSDPGTGFTLTLEDAGWDMTSNELSVGDLVIQGGGERLEIGGLVTLPKADSGLESVSGDLAGQLSINQPDELAALLARIGIAPPLPEGYSIGTSVAVDFALSGSRANTRLDVGLRAQEPALPGLAFESVEADAAITSDSVTMNRLRARTAGGLGTLDGSGRFAADGLELEIAADAIPLAFLVGLLDSDLSAEATGTVSVRMSAEGNPESPTVALVAHGDSLAIDGAPVTIALDIRQEANEIRLAALTIDLADLADLRGTGSVPVAFGTTGLITGDLDAARMRIDASLPGVFPYLFPDAAELWPEATLELTAALDGRSGSLRASASGFERADELTIIGIEPMTEFQLTANATDVLDLRSTLTADLTSGETLLASAGTELGSGIVGEARLPVAELSHFAPGIDLPGGLLLGSFRVPNDGTGPEGEVTLENVMVKLSAQIPTVSALTGSLVYADQIVSVEALTGTMGGAPVSLSGSWSFVDDEATPIEIRLGAQDALLLRSPDMQLRADVDIDLVGSLRSMRLAGDIAVNEARYTRPIQLFSLGTTAASPSSDLQLFGIEADWARSTLLDVAVTADRTIVMSNNLFEGSLSTDLTIGGNLAVPRPAGRVFAETGTVRLPTARLSVKELEVRFPADAAFAPQVRLSATTSVQGYDMDLTLDGQLPSVEVRIVSAPPLPTDEALILLTTGSRSSDLSFAPDVSGSLTAVGTVVGRQILNQLSRQMSEDERGFLERIDFEVERERETGKIGGVGVEYQLDDAENWVLRFDRKEEESYTLQLGWRLWIE